MRNLTIFQGKIMSKSSRPSTNVSSEVFVSEILRQADLSDGSITNLANELGLTVNSAYARYAKYRKEMKAETGVQLPKLPKTIERKATLNWKALAAMVTDQGKTDETSKENTEDLVDTVESPDMLYVEVMPEYDMTENEANELVEVQG